VMLQYPQTLLRFEAHTDSTGSARVNQRLSELRASEVERLLVERGVPRERMQPVGFGQRRPIAENTDDAGRRSNRRVEFRAFLPVKGKP
jgi:outer membrane protein OmpA-like peptidoglycan-associated protein